MKNKIRCHSCFNYMEFCRCGIPEPSVETEVLESGILLPRATTPFVGDPDVVIVAIVGGDDSEYDTISDDERFLSLAHHPSGGHILIEEIEEFLHTRE